MYVKLKYLNYKKLSMQIAGKLRKFETVEGSQIIAFIRERRQQTMQSMFRHSLRITNKGVSLSNLIQ